MQGSPTDMTLNPLEQAHYARHLMLPDFGIEGQGRLKTAKVLIVGAGGLGCPLGLYLAAAGVGHIGVADFDDIDRSNLQRQIAYSTSTVGEAKADSLVSAMRALNPLITYTTHATRLDADNVMGIITAYDLVIDGSDNFATRYLLADACFLQKIPLLQGAVYQYEGQLALFTPEGRPCYRCLFEEAPTQNVLAPCGNVGVLGVVPGAIGVMMATEAIKFLTGLGTSLEGKLLRYQPLTQNLTQTPILPNDSCPLCGIAPTIYDLQNHEPQGCANHFSTTMHSAYEVSVPEAKTLIAQGAKILDVREDFEYAQGHLPKTLHIPIGELSPEILQRTFSTDDTLLVYCQHGVRSLYAVERFRELGYTKSFSLAGGLVVWE